MILDDPPQSKYCQDNSLLQSTESQTEQSMLGKGGGANDAAAATNVAFKIR